MPNEPTEEQSPQKQDRYTTLIEQTKATRFKPEQSGNPGGRPKGKSITAELRKLLDTGNNAEDMAKVLYDMTKKMSPYQLQALREVLDRTEGKAVNRLEVTGLIMTADMLEMATRLGDEEDKQIGDSNVEGTG